MNGDIETEGCTMKLQENFLCACGRTHRAQVKSVVTGAGALQRVPAIAAQLGDMLAKYISLGEWRIAHIITGEYYCSTVAGAAALTGLTVEYRMPFS